MHEMAIAQGILEIALDAAQRNGAERITKIKLLVGEMTEVEPDSLIFCFSAVAAQTPAARAELEIAIVPLKAKCHDCGREFGIERYRFFCPHCRSANLETISGRELQVQHLEVE